MVGVIDEAFRSRIHLSLQFPSINLSSTLEIWGKLLQRIASDNEHMQVKIEFNKDKLLKFARKHYESHEKSESTWNGRQIRNAFQLAIAMDQHDRLQLIQSAKQQGLEPPKSTSYIKLRVDNYKEIARTAHEFENYMGSFMDTPAHRAIGNSVRNDYHDSHRVQEHQNRRGNEWLNLPTRETSRPTTAESSRLDESVKSRQRGNKTLKRSESGPQRGGQPKKTPEQDRPPREYSSDKDSDDDRDGEEGSSSGSDDSE